MIDWNRGGVYFFSASKKYECVGVCASLKKTCYSTRKRVMRCLAILLCER